MQVHQPKGRLYYFSSSGNTALVCRAIADDFVNRGWDFQAISIEGLDSASIMPEELDLLGIGFPVFAWDVPLNVRAFMYALPHVSKAIPAFSIATYAGIKGNVHFKVARRLRKKGFVPVWSGGIKSEENHPAQRRKLLYPFFAMSHPNDADIEKIKNVFVPAIIERAGALRPRVPLYNPLYILLDIISPLYHRTTDLWMKKWIVTDKCTKCGLCVRNCPAQIITTGDDGIPVVAKSGCIGCYRCVNVCPTRAFESRLTRKGDVYTRLLGLVKK